MERAKRIVAIETSGRHGSAAILYGEGDDAKLVKQIALTGDQRTAQALAPALQQILRDADWPPQTIDLVAVTVGPGSFTGLRIGVTTAKTFAYAVEADVIGINTLDAIAAQAPTSTAPLWTVVDAQRRELFAARFVADDAGCLCYNCETAIISQEAWLAGLRAGERVTGPGLHRLAASLPAGIEVVPQDFWQPMAEAIGSLAWQKYQSGQRDDVWKLSPNYYRASAAEEKVTRNT